MILGRKMMNLVLDSNTSYSVYDSYDSSNLWIIFYLFYFSSKFCSQEITQGVRNSTRAVRLAEERLRRFTTTPPSGFQISFSYWLSFLLNNKVEWWFHIIFTWLVSMQTKVAAPIETKVAARPTIARTARNMREGIVKGRAILQMLFTLTCYSGIVFNFFRTRTKDVKGKA